MAQRLRVLYLVGLVVNPIFIGLDYLAYRDQLSSLLVLRLILEVGLFVGYVSLHLQLRLLSPHVLVALWVLIPNLCITHMILLLGNFNTTYYNGLILVALTAAVIVPVAWRSHLVAQIGTLLYFYAALFISQTPIKNVGFLIESMFFLFFTCVALQISLMIYERLQEAEFMARKELETSNHKLLELDRLKSDFFANISHELRTPLTLSLGAYKTLQKMVAPTECQEVVAAGLRNTTRLLYLIDELLDLAKFDSGRATVHKRPMDLAQLARDVAAHFETGPQRRVHFTGLSNPVRIQGDQRQLKKVLSNLLSNAFKFSDRDKGEVWITVEHGEGTAQVQVKDNGIGIPREHVARIFDRFTQVESSVTRRYEGTGIGLALVKEIVTLHGGTISVDSEMGVGSTFCVVLPVGDIDGLDTVCLEEGELNLPPLEEPGLAGQPQPHHTEPALSDERPVVLVADDNPDMRAYLERLLSRQYRLATARDGREALQTAKALHPDVIVTDVMMPDLSGYDLLTSIRQDAALQSTPIIFLTARAGVEARVESLEAGVDDYVCKPFTEEELFARIKNQLRLHAQERALTALNGKLRELDERKSQFVSVVAHELRTPMSAIGGFADNMLDGLGGMLTEKHRHYVQRIKANVDRITRMVNELLDLAKIEMGNVELRFEAIAVREFVMTLAEGFQGMAHERGLTLRVSEAAASLRVCGDVDKLTQIMSNLVHNAMKFTPSGGEVGVDVQQRDDGFVQICVADTGCGIEISQLPKVFDRFYREGSVSREGRGAGLGLAIVKHLVELHHGQIWVESIPEKGSRFFFTLPGVGSAVEPHSAA
jgi:signal transduction histidine kinase